jgi:hypothetical protein
VVTIGFLIGIVVLLGLLYSYTQRGGFGLGPPAAPSKLTPEDPPTPAEPDGGPPGTEG